MRTLRPLACLAVALAACTVGPDYEPPVTSMPASWTERPEDPNAAAPPVDLARWWTAFEDPALDALVARAIEGNLDLKIAEARIREARALRAVAEGGLYPTVDVNASYARTRRSVNAFGAGGAGSGVVFSPERRFDSYQAGFDAAWELDVFGGVRRAVEAADADLEATVEDRRAILVSLLGEVGRQYVEVRRFQRQLAITRDNARLQRDTAGLTRQRVTAGLNSELDAKRIEAQASFTEAQIPALDRDLAHAVHRLGVLLGREPGALRGELSEARPIPQAKAALHVGIPSDLLRRRPDIRRAERALAAATARIGVATADLYPRFSLVGSLGLASLESGDLVERDSLFGSIGASLRWPLFAGGRIEANIEAVTAREEQAFRIFESTLLTSLEEVENAIVAFGREQSRRRSLADAASAQRTAAELVRDRFRQGLVDFLDVLDAERSLNVAENGLAESHAFVSEHLIALYKALGGGWDVRADNSSVASPRAEGST